MKYFFLLALALILLMCVSQSKAITLISDSMESFPSDTVRNRNPVFLIKGNRQPMNNLLAENKIYFLDGQTKLRIQIIERIGRQLLIRPEEYLKPNRKYLLVMEKDTAATFQAREVRFAFTTNDQVDHSPPKWICTPFVAKKRFIEYGCGPSISTDFVFSFEDESECFVRVRHFEENEDDGQEFYSFIYNGAVRIGIDEAYFARKEKVKYRVYFELIDFSGNKAENIAGPIKYSNPRPSDTSKYSIYEGCKCFDMYSIWVYGALILFAISILLWLNYSGKFF